MSARRAEAEDSSRVVRQRRGFYPLTFIFYAVEMAEQNEMVGIATAIVSVVVVCIVEWRGEANEGHGLLCPLHPTVITSCPSYFL